MKKLLISLVSLSMVTALILNPSDVKAINFKGQEDKYIKICSSTNLAKSQEDTCKEFNKYLKEQNKQLNAEIKKEQNTVTQTKNDILEVQAEIKDVQKKINAKQSEITYLQNSIKKIEKNITKKDNEMRDRLYAMQSDYNSNFFIQFLFGANSFSDFFSRINSLNDITSYEKELISELSAQKNNLSEQKKSLDEAKAILQQQKKKADQLEDNLLEIKKDAEATINANKDQIKENEAAQKEINETLAEIANSIPQGDSGGNIIKGDSATGNKIAEIAIGRLGCPYYWGATGPNYFDCSGLVYYCLKNAGISGGRNTANGYARSGKSISYNELQAGDVVAFRRSGSSTYHHIGIYIGGGVVVHASGEGSTCLGNHASKGHVVKRTNLSSFSKYIKAYRRLY